MSSSPTQQEEVASEQNEVLEENERLCMDEGSSPKESRKERKLRMLRIEEEQAERLKKETTRMVEKRLKYLFRQVFFFILFLFFLLSISYDYV